MNVQFGKCNFDGKPVDPTEFDRVRSVLAPYGPDGERLICKDNCGILYRAFHTTKESRHEIQPCVSKSEFVLTWDGRLDNRKELVEEIGGEISLESTDVEIVAAVYQRWGTTAFAKLIGDWALSVWSSKNQSLVLAKDFVGTRHLYYTAENGQVTWCTILDPLVLFAGHTWKLEEEYIAGWLSSFPVTHLTPYVGLHSVPPSSFVRFFAGKQQIRKFWEFDGSRNIRYRTDTEYEEHFRQVFSVAVKRRLRSGTAVFAELSGGMDSSSIVCVADNLIRDRLSDAPRLETVSYCSNAEPNWNEQPYFAVVEKHRGRIGYHIDVSSTETPSCVLDSNLFGVTPNACAQGSDSEESFAACLRSDGTRVLLSGIGGDESTGGVPTPVPELADLIARAHLREFGHRLIAWALYARRPWLHLLWDVLRPFAFSSLIQDRDAASWLQPGFLHRNRNAIRGHERRLRFLGPLPSFQENLEALDMLRRQMSCASILPIALCEVRYPYLDRDFLEFMYAIPRTQIVRPGQRRSLMRRALRGIVPDEILSRRRKAYVVRAPTLGAAFEWKSLIAANQELITTALGIVDIEKLSKALCAAQCGRDTPIVLLMRTLLLERWLRSVTSRGILPSNTETDIRRIRVQLAE